jgi:uncharacterized protein (DUF3084 family)
MREKSSHRRRQKDCSFKASGSASVRASSSAEERTASVRHLVGEMEASFTAAQARARAGGEGAPVTSDEEIETLAGEAIRRTRRDARSSSKRKMSYW